MRDFIVSEKEQSMTAAKLLQLVLEDDAHIHPIVSDYVEYGRLKEKLLALPLDVALEVCNKILRAVAATYAVDLMLKDVL